jgi:hypothetical protein
VSENGNSPNRHEGKQTTRIIGNKGMSASSSYERVFNSFNASFELGEELFRSRIKRRRRDKSYIYNLRSKKLIPSKYDPRRTTRWFLEFRMSRQGTVTSQTSTQSWLLVLPHGQIIVDRIPLVFVTNRDSWFLLQHQRGTIKLTKVYCCVPMPRSILDPDPAVFGK